MNSHDRILAVLEGRPVDRLPRMPITMMFAADVVGVPYGRYATDYRAMVEAQLRTAETLISTTFPAFPTRPARPPIAGRRCSSSTTNRRRLTKSKPSWPTRRCWRS